MVLEQNRPGNLISGRRDRVIVRIAR
jgi:hypothetical protein